MLQAGLSRIGRAASGKVQFEFTGRLDFYFFLKSARGISQSTTAIIAHPAGQVKPILAANVRLSWRAGTRGR
jgi:hypothetical protein